MATTERVGIEIELMGYESTISRMENLERKLRGLGGRRVRVQVEARIKDLQSKLRGLRSEAARLQEAMRTTGKGEAFNNLKRQLAQVRSEIRLTSAEINNMKSALRNVPMKSLGQVFNDISSKAGHIGSAMQSFGNGITRMTAPLRMLTSGALLGAGFSAINKVTEGLSSGFSRYDTMKKYPRMMAQLGYNSEEAQKSIDALDKSVRGLPTGLDEMVDLSQRFTMTTGDMVKGTKLAIATNNAFLASMSTDTQRYPGMMQLQDVINGKDMNAREWMSLAASMGPAIRIMGQELGKSGDDLNQWVKDVQSGKIANEDFIDALVKAGGKGGKLEEVAQLSKDTWQAFSANIGNAFSRMTAGVIESMDEIVKVATGGKFDSVNSYLTDKVIPGIDNLTKKAKEWIDAHPDEIINFFKDLKSFDWKGLGKGFVEGVADIGKGIKGIMDWMGEKNIDMEKIGKFAVFLPILGRALTSFGGFLKGTRHLWGAFGAGLAGLAGGSFLGGLGTFITGLAGLKGVGKAVENAEALTKGGKGMKPGAIFKGVVPVLEGIAAVGAVITESAVIAAIDTKLIKVSVDNIKGIVDGIGSVFESVKGLKGQIGKGDFETLNSSVQSIADVYTALFGEQTNASKGAKGITKGAGGGQMGSGLKALSARAGELKKGVESMKNLTALFTEFNSMATQMSTLASSLRGMQGAAGGRRADTGIQGMTTMIEDMMKNLERVVNAVGGLPDTAQTEVKVTSVSKVIGTVQAIASKLSSLGTGALASTDSAAFTAINNIQTMIDSVGNALNTAGIEGLQAQVDTFSASVDKVFTSLNKSFANVQVTVKIKVKIEGLETALSQIRTAGNRIRQAANSIPTSITRNVNIHISPNVTTGSYSIPKITPTTGSGQTGRNLTPTSHRHTGGVIYRAGGGDVPKGSDTVRAWLTPGEYVQRKKAVDYFGLDFMRSVNNLDLGGAMRALSARAGLRTTNIYNTTNNNNVTQNIKTNNPNFAFKRSNRYVMAL